MRLSTHVQRWIALAIAVLSLAAVPAVAQVTSLSPTTVDAVDRAVVMVDVMLQSRGRITHGSGSGVIIDQAGLILTAHHVVARATRVEVKLRDGEVLPTQVVGVDPAFDTALLRVETGTPLPVIPLGTSSRLQRGDVVTVFGRAPGRQAGPTTGAFLGINLEVRPGAPFLVTTAPAYPGDSGGALVNDRGEVVGILSGVSRDGAVSLSVAIDAIRAIYADLQAGTVRHPWIGIVGETITDELAQELDLPVRNGVLVLEVVEGSPAAMAGLLGGQATAPPALPRGGDVITAVDGRPLTTFGELAAYVLGKRIGDTVALEIHRSGRALTVPVVLMERPSL